jgi:hypothetical protein
VIRFVSVPDTDKQRLLKDYPALFSPTAQQAVAELLSELERHGAEKSHPIVVLLQSMGQDVGAKHSSTSMRDLTATEIPVPVGGHTDLLPGDKLALR